MVPHVFVTPNLIKQIELTKVITSMPVYISDQNAKIQLYFVIPDDIPVYDKFEHQIYTTRDEDSNEDRQLLRHITTDLKNKFYATASREENSLILAI
ncbi:12962_t:CDS:2 [Funneliformis mosseae]|uniref:12962_t:CDS:1 n=1 Tax=Funneliformis mosseae TaxID=27381 RepID=A0A9N8Z0A7_FUNMO|nr:12962_t:CDS:2 [Funneliformis mosseae]